MDETLQLVLLRVAEQLDGGVTLVGSVVYIGPKETSTKLATVATLRRQEVQAFAGETKARLLRERSLAMGRAGRAAGSCWPTWPSGAVCGSRTPKPFRTTCGRPPAGPPFPGPSA